MVDSINAMHSKYTIKLNQFESNSVVGAREFLWPRRGRTIWLIGLFMVFNQSYK